VVGASGGWGKPPTLPLRTLLPAALPLQFFEQFIEALLELAAACQRQPTLLSLGIELSSGSWRRAVHSLLWIVATLAWITS
jgi:hypothetical protein